MNQVNTYCTAEYADIVKDTSHYLGIITLIAGCYCFKQTLVPTIYDLLTYGYLERVAPFRTAKLVASGTILGSIGIGLFKVSYLGCSFE